MALSRYVLGLVLLVAVVGSAGFGGVALRRQLLPFWSGAVARLAEAVIALGIVLVVAEVLGTVGLFRIVTVVAGCVAVGATLGVKQWSQLGDCRHRPPAPAVAPFALAVSLAGAVLVVAHWGAGVQQAFKGGMLDPDTLSYHGPIAARFVQQASIIHPPWVYSDPVVGFYPATSELVHAIGILLFSRDVMSPLINIAWLGLALLAGWCVGRPRGIAPATLLLVAVLMDLPILSSSQPGSGDNDIMELALLLSSLALLFNASPVRAQPPPSPDVPVAAVALAGGAAGLAVATKLTMLVPAGLLTIAVLVALPAARCRFAWVLALVSGSVIWFARNAIAFGNPVPALRLGIGPIGLPSPKLPPSYSVADYLANGGIWKHIFIPSLGAAFGFIWPALLGLALIGVILGALSWCARLDRMLAVAALLATVAYVFTPRTAFGSKGFPFFFAANLRYVLPATVIGVLLVARVPRAGSLFRSPWILMLLAAGLVVDLAHGGRTELGLAPGSGIRATPSFLGTVPVLGATPHFLGTAAMWVGVGGAVTLALCASMKLRVTLPAWLALVALFALGLLAWPVERAYLRNRYASGTLAFARALHHQRIAEAGFIPTYAAYGGDLSNRVTELAHQGPHGLRTPIDSCRAWRSTLAAGNFSYVITSMPLYQSLWYPGVPDGAAWTRSDPSATELSATPDFIGGTISVFKIHGRMHPESC